MKTSKKLLLILALTLFAINTGYAKEVRKRGKGHSKIFKELGLSEDQMIKVKALRKEDRGLNKEVKRTIRANREKMKEVFASGSSDSELRTLHKEMKTLRNQRDDKKFEKMLKIRSILTPEQRVKFQKLKSKRRQGKKEIS